MSDKKKDLREFTPADVAREAKKHGVPFEEATVAVEAGQAIADILQKHEVPMAKGWAILMSIIIGSIAATEVTADEKIVLARRAAGAFIRALQHAGLLADDDTLMHEAVHKLGLRESPRTDTRPMRRQRTRWKS